MDLDSQWLHLNNFDLIRYQKREPGPKKWSRRLMQVSKIGTRVDHRLSGSCIPDRKQKCFMLITGFQSSGSLKFVGLVWPILSIVGAGSEISRKLTDMIYQNMTKRNTFEEIRIPSNTSKEIPGNFNCFCFWTQNTKKTFFHIHVIKSCDRQVSMMADFGPTILMLKIM